jgi:hypothetical protein
MIEKFTPMRTRHALAFDESSEVSGHANGRANSFSTTRQGADSHLNRARRAAGRVTSRARNRPRLPIRAHRRCSDPVQGRLCGRQSRSSALRSSGSSPVARPAAQAYTGRRAFSATAVFSPGSLVAVAVAIIPRKTSARPDKLADASRRSAMAAACCCTFISIRECLHQN